MDDESRVYLTSMCFIHSINEDVWYYTFFRTQVINEQQWILPFAIEKTSDANEPATNRQKIVEFSRFSNIGISDLYGFDGNQLEFLFDTKKNSIRCSQTLLLAEKLENEFGVNKWC